MPDFNPDILVSATTNTALVSGLKPNSTYTAQVSVEGFRAPDGSLISVPWSASLTFETIGDEAAPSTPNNFNVILDGETFVATWEAPTTNEDATPLENDFRYYILEFYPAGDPSETQEYFLFYEETKFELPLPLNRLLFGVPEGNLTFSIRSQDLSRNESQPSEVTVGGSAPSVPDLQVGSGASITTVELDWNNDRSVNYYTVYRTPTPVGGCEPFIHPDDEAPAEPTWKMVGSTSPIDDNNPDRRILFYDLPPPGDYCYVVVAHNSFNLTTESAVVSASAENPTTGDSPITDAAPAIPQGAIETGEHYFSINEYDVSSMDPQPRFVDVYASRDDFVSSDELVGRLNVTDGLVSGRFVWVVDGDQSVWLRVRASSFVEPGSSAPLSPITQSAGLVTQGGTDYIADFAVTNAKIQNVDASKLIANTAFVNDLDIQSTFTLKTGGIMRSEVYTPGFEGWYLDHDGFAEFNDLTVRGTVQATSGFLDSMSVRNQLTVGDSTAAGSVQSYTFNASEGWRIESDGSVDFRNGTFNGTIQATSGFLSGLDVNGQLTISSDAGSIQHSSGNFALNSDGTASFSSIVTIWGSINIQGTLNVNSSSFIYSNLTIGSGGKLIVGTGSSTAELASTGSLEFKYGSDTWSIVSTNQNQLLMRSHGLGDGIAFRTRSSTLQNAIRFQTGGTFGTLRAAIHMESNGDVSMNTDNSGFRMGSSFQITSGSSTTEWYAFGSITFRGSGDRTNNLGTDSQRWNNGYIFNVTSSSDLNLKEDVEDSNLGLDFINMLRPVEFYFKDDRTRKRHGLIAQDVQQVMSDIGIGYQDFSAIQDPQQDDRLDGDTLGLVYEQFIGPLIKAVQDLSVKLDDVSGRIDALGG